MDILDDMGVSKLSANVFFFFNFKHPFFTRESSLIFFNREETPVSGSKSLFVLEQHFFQSIMF